MSATSRIRAAYYRGGTSNAVVFNGADLPADRSIRDRIFLHVLGSPDPYGRQLNGMGGGISSLSKVIIVEPSARDDADVDYTFVQIAVKEPVADYGAMCGNMSSSIGAFAVEEGMVTVVDGGMVVRVHNTNTGKLFNAHFAVKNGAAVEEGTFEIPGVAGTGAPVKLEFLYPGGASTGKLLPTGKSVETLAVDGIGTFVVSLVDASNPVVFLRAEDVGCTAMEAPQDLDADADLLKLIDAVRRAGGVAMGMAGHPDEVKLSNPRIAIVARPGPFTALDGRSYEADQYDVAIRLVSMGNFHRAITLSGAMCVGVAASIPGSLVHDVAQAGGEVCIGNPSGVLPVRADVKTIDGRITAVSATTFRTQRRMMEGSLLYPSDLLRRSNCLPEQKANKKDHG